MGGGAKPQVVPHGPRAFTLFPKRTKNWLTISQKLYLASFWCDLEKKNPKIEKTYLCLKIRWVGVLSPRWSLIDQELLHCSLKEQKTGSLSVRSHNNW